MNNRGVSFISMILVLMIMVILLFLGLPKFLEYQKTGMNSAAGILKDAREKGSYYEYNSDKAIEIQREGLRRQGLTPDIVPSGSRVVGTDESFEVREEPKPAPKPKPKPKRKTENDEGYIYIGFEK